MSDMRVVVHVNQAHAELKADLASVPQRFRAERLRTLAAIGLMMSHGGMPATKPDPHREVSETQKKETKPNDKAKRFARGVGGI